MYQRFSYSEAGLTLTREFEGLRLEAYQDCAGVWTIGYGHTGTDVVAGRNVSELEAEALLRGDISTAVACVNRVVTAAIQQNHFDALVDFCFNVGVQAFTGSSLLRDLNQGRFEEAATQFGLWVHAGGKAVPGLAKRRAAETAMFRGVRKAAVR
jgi:lysozyme